MTAALNAPALRASLAPAVGVTQTKDAHMTDRDFNQAPPATRRLYRVTVIEWLTHDAMIEAASTDEAETEARRLWDENAEHEVFSFCASGIDGIVVDDGYTPE